MCDFLPGDELVCIDDTDLLGCCVVGSIYICEKVSYDGLNDYEHCTACGDLTGILNLVGVVHPKGWALCSCQFKKRLNISQWLETNTDFEEPKRAKEFTTA